MIEKIEKLILEVQAVIKEFGLSESTEDYIKAVHIVRQRRGFEDKIKEMLKNDIVDVDSTIESAVQKMINDQIRRLQ